jgi:hypothetical protein
MRRARMEGSAPALWLLAALLACVFVALDLRFSCGPEPKTSPPPSDFIELPPLPLDAGTSPPRQR